MVWEFIKIKKRTNCSSSLEFKYLDEIRGKRVKFFETVLNVQ